MIHFLLEILDLDAQNDSMLHICTVVAATSWNKVYIYYRNKMVLDPNGSGRLETRVGYKKPSYRSFKESAGQRLATV